MIIIKIILLLYFVTPAVDFTKREAVLKMTLLMAINNLHPTQHKHGNKKEMKHLSNMTTTKLFNTIQKLL